MALNGNMKNNFFLLFIVLFFFYCKNDNVVATENKNINIPYFNSDSAFKFIEDQVSFGPRNLSSPGAALCLNYLKNKISKYADNIIIQTSKTKTYDNVEHKFFNIIGEFNPENKDRILLCAHWDTRHIADYDNQNQNLPILGANDGGSGVGVLLECARQFNKKEPNIGIDIILFDAEDYGQPKNS